MDITRDDPIMILRSTDWVTCPYNPAHRMKYSRFHNHFVKCKRSHPDDPRKQCPYNASELIYPKDYDDHVLGCHYKILFGNHGQSPKTDLLQYDAPCHFKFGERSKPLRKTKIKIQNVDYNVSDEEIESVSIVGGHEDLDDDDYEYDDADPVYDVMSRRSEAAKAQTETNADNFVPIANMSTKSQMVDDTLSRSDSCPKQLHDVLVPERGFGRGALYRKLKDSKDHSLDVRINVLCPKEQNGNETVAARSQESDVKGSQNGNSPFAQLQFDVENNNFNKIGRGRGTLFRHLSQK